MGAEANDDEPILNGGMVGVLDQQGAFVSGHRLGLTERHAMLPQICGSLFRISDEVQIAHEHKANVTTTQRQGSSAVTSSKPGNKERPNNRMQRTGCAGR
jgi:hypothetical protein